MQKLKRGWVRAAPVLFLVTGTIAAHATPTVNAFLWNSLTQGVAANKFISDCNGSGEYFTLAKGWNPSVPFPDPQVVCSATSFGSTVSQPCTGTTPTQISVEVFSFNDGTACIRTPVSPFVNMNRQCNVPDLEPQFLGTVPGGVISARLCNVSGGSCGSCTNMYLQGTARGTN